MPFLDAAGGIRLHFAEAGDAAARPLVLVHGWSLSHRAFDAQRRALSRGFRVVAPDLRGHGLSAAGPCTLADHVDDLVRLFEALELRGALLAGWSWGGEVALAAAPRLAGRVRALALLSTTPCFAAREDWPHALPASRVRALRARLARAPADTRAAFFDGLFAPGELPEPARAALAAEQLALPLDAGAAAATLDALAATDLRAGLAAIDLPALVLHGALDPLCPPAAARWLGDRLPRARTLILEGAGHAPQLTRAAEVGAALEALAEDAP